MRKALHLLGILDDIDIDWMAINGSVLDVRSGDTLITEKQPIESLYILLEGELAVFTNKDGAAHVATLLPGEIVGEISFVDSRPPLASVVATKDSQVFAIPRAVLAAKLMKDQAFGRRFYQSIATFLADRLYVTVGRFGYGSAQQDVDVDELSGSAMAEIDLAAVRFDKLLRRLRAESRA